MRKFDRRLQRQGRVGIKRKRKQGRKEEQGREEGGREEGGEGLGVEPITTSCRTPRPNQKRKHKNKADKAGAKECPKKIQT